MFALLRKEISQEPVKEEVVAGISYMPLKGSLIRDWYPEPWMHTCTDMEILVKKEDIECATAILCEKFSYRQDKIAMCDISCFRKQECIWNCILP